ncbi:MAG: amidohydrolase family protein [Devosia sp.]|uniref:amidohydrolase family protein n=1 Tax=Devosia sp. TaxID=1871048 RepID=UPI001A41CA02|nr:amidohydrolase family protein [Devosia sp.]MBL8599954.1 amidohydrolase family protein [Devosia sp.]
MDTRIRDIVEAMTFVDTHEHLVEESVRLARTVSPILPAGDWANLISQYLPDDLLSAGMPQDVLRTVLSPGCGASEKARLLEPWWARTRHTGYGLGLRLSLQALYGEDDLTQASASRIAEKYEEAMRPGFYRTTLCDVAQIEHCQVNSLERIFMSSQQPELLRQDLSFVELARCSPEDVSLLERETGARATCLDEWLGTIDLMFDRHGHEAVAIKNQSAYARSLDYLPVSKARAARAFDEMKSAWGQYSPDSARALNDFCFRYCLMKAAEHNLPVKLHTGYYAGQAPMPLERLRDNAPDVGRLLVDFPETTFVLMHAGYPYQDEPIALAKRYPNAIIDMCWTWIINPAAGIRFLREFLMAAPASKVLTFGGDHIMVENVVGHSMIARRGVAQVLAELVESGWIEFSEAADLAETLMRGNATRIFTKQGQGRGELRDKYHVG